MNNVVLKGKLGAGFNDDRYTLPKDGNPGDILVKTETGSAWEKQDNIGILRQRRPRGAHIESGAHGSQLGRNNQVKEKI